jgi:single-stranded DNA-binding protein
MLNNKVHLIGTVCSPFEYSHTVCGEDFYIAYISTLRMSGAADVLPVMVSARTVDVKNDMTDYRIEVIGSFRSYNRHDKDGSRNSLVLYIWTEVFRETDAYDYNAIEIDGYLCKAPVYRKTPLGREITDLLVAVNRPSYSKSDYIPAVSWGRNALYVSSFRTGDHIALKGRIQSRGYIKIVNGAPEQRTAYEVSVLTVFDGVNDYGRKETDQPVEVNEIDIEQ